MVLQTGGRYDDDTPRGFMKPLGIWIENFALPAVINECLLQSYSGELRFFPNWKKASGAARFQSLRAVGAFLASAEFQEGKVTWVRITAEVGGVLRLVNPWPRQLAVRRRSLRKIVRGRHVRLPMRAGETLEMTEA